MTDTPSHFPPTNEQAEDICLGVFMLDASTLDIADQQGLRMDDFVGANKTLYEVVRYLHERSELSELTVVSELKARRKLTACGGTAHVLSLAERAMGHVSTAKRHIDDVIDAAKLRSMWTAGTEIVRMSVDHPDKVTKLIERSVLLVEGVARDAQRTNGNVENADSLAEWSVRHVLGETEQVEKWAYPLDQVQMATGGIGRGQLVSIGALPGVGKSVFKNQILLGLPTDVRVGIINLEMESHDEQIRLLSSLTGIDGRLITDRRLSTEQQEQLIEAADTLSKYQYEFHTGSKSIDGVRAIQRRHRYDVIMLDHFHRLAGVEDYATLVRSSRMLKSIALDDHCAIVNLFQLNSSPNRADPGETPTISRVKGGPALLEDSDQLLFLHRNFNDMGYPTNNGQLIYAKNRHGQSGTATKLVFNPKRCAFEEAA